MTWHVITRVGSADDFEPALHADEPRVRLSLGRVGDPDSLGPDAIKAIAKTLGRVPTDAATDLLTIAASAFAADLRIPRNLDLDRWTRRIQLHVPVSDPALWTTVLPRLARLLSFLTGDVWEFDVRQRVQHPLPKVGAKRTTVDTVCLFSGGLDSLVGAIDFLSSGEPVVLVGHHGSGITNKVQQRVIAPLREKFGGKVTASMHFVEPPKNREVGEQSMRSRSILFLALGVAVATAVSAKRLAVAENGLISLNVPLTLTRLGSHSTRTTHPHVMAMFSDLLHGIGINLVVELPYRFQTKGEMLAGTKDPSLLGKVAPLTMSCSHPETGRFRGRKPGNHCGYCVPCIIRRAAFHRAGMPHGVYDTDIVKKPPPPESDTAADLRAFKIALERFRRTTHANHVAAVLGTGPIAQGDVGAFAETYARGMNEVGRLLYPRRKL